MKQSNESNQRRQTGARIKDALLVEVRVLAVRQHRRLNDLLEEALEDLLKKYADTSAGVKKAKPQPQK